MLKPKLLARAKGKVDAGWPAICYQILTVASCICIYSRMHKLGVDPIIHLSMSLVG